MVKKGMIWGVVALFLMATAWGLHLQERETTLGDEILRSISSKEVVQTVTILNKNENTEEKRELASEEDIQHFFDASWKQELMKKNANSINSEYVILVETDADKEYEISLNEKEIRIVNQSYDVPKDNALLTTVQNYLDSSSSKK